MNKSAARKRFGRMLRLWALAGLAAGLGAVAWLWPQYGLASVHLYIAAFAGTFAVVLLGGSLMALAFASSASGHDAAVDGSGGGSSR